jgi:hypothetical protein
VCPRRFFFLAEGMQKFFYPLNSVLLTLVDSSCKFGLYASMWF